MRHATRFAFGRATRDAFARPYLCPIDRPRRGDGDTLEWYARRRFVPRSAKTDLKFGRIWQKNATFAQNSAEFGEAAEVVVQ